MLITCLDAVTGDPKLTFELTVDSERCTKETGTTETVVSLVKSVDHFSWHLMSFLITGKRIITMTDFVAHGKIDKPRGLES